MHCNEKLSDKMHKKQLVTLVGYFNWAAKPGLLLNNLEKKQRALGWAQEKHNILILEEDWKNYFN